MYDEIHIILKDINQMYEVLKDEEESKNKFILLYE